MKRNLYIGILVTVTIVFVLAGTIINVGRHIPVFSFFGKDSKTISKDYTDVTGEFTSVEMDSNLGDITIESGSSFAASFTGLEKLAPEIRIENGVLRITQDKKVNVNANPTKLKAKIKVTIPSDLQLTSLNANLDLGDLKINGIKANELVVNESLGDVRIEDCEFSGADINENLGDIRMELPQSLDSYGMDLEVDLGEIKIDGRSKGREYSQSGDIMIKAHNNLGDIRINESN